MNTNLIKISFAVVWWNPSTFAITLQYTTSLNQLQINSLQIQKYQYKIQTSSKCPLQWFGEIPAHWQPHSTSSSSTTSFTYEDHTNIYMIIIVVFNMIVFKEIQLTRSFPTLSSLESCFVRWVLSLESAFVSKQIINSSHSTLLSCSWAFT